MLLPSKLARFMRLEKTLEKAVKWSKSDESQQKSKVVITIKTKFPVICTPYSIFSKTSRSFWLVYQFHLKILVIQIFFSPVESTRSRVKSRHTAAHKSYRARVESAGEFLPCMIKKIC
jgi:hypothetical protein